ncbi:MAG: hypothetical protein ACRD26_13205 [Vicinamibacterales bacterium]
MSGKSFVSLESLAGRAPTTPAQVLDAIRRIYFRTTKQTIHDDFAHAIELVKSLPDEETREKATVYMEGLAQMRKDWTKKTRQDRRARLGGKVKG